jgi:hypothetical protein
LASRDINQKIRPDLGQRPLQIVAGRTGLNPKLLRRLRRRTRPNIDPADNLDLIALA